MSKNGEKFKIAIRTIPGMLSDRGLCSASGRRRSACVRACPKTPEGPGSPGIMGNPGRPGGCEDIFFVYFSTATGF